MSFGHCPPHHPDAHNESLTFSNQTEEGTFYDILDGLSEAVSDVKPSEDAGAWNFQVPVCTMKIP